MSTKPPSAAKLEANRANAQKSTGPRTEQGKARSSQNAIKIGLLSDSLTVQHMERSDDFADRHDELKQHLQPQGPQQAFWVFQIALSQWRLERLARLEAGIFDLAFFKAYQTYGTRKPDVEAYVNLEEEGPVTPYAVEQHRNLASAAGMEKIINDGDTLTLYLRYQNLTERQLRRAEEKLAELQKEPKKTAQPADPPTTSLPEKEPTVPPELPSTGPAPKPKTIKLNLRHIKPAAHNHRDQRPARRHSFQIPQKWLNRKHMMLNWK